MRKIIATTAAAMLTLASVSAYANTRADDAPISFDSADSADFIVNDDDDDDEGALFPILIGIVLAIGFIIVIVSDTGEDDASPGTGG
ncbi:hypothetical protein [Aurantiacibacter aquimixticola]|uniref:Ferrochelatase n=1 Tax=Aurantiacibacter aquimixticola TaxID=1958945 RepID=A0A419RUH1_9SPHN|nr:hypothetical protein [Aurantiacibacter aquimixticola]RJY09443.1 hypothetical protein D6201_08815 [Aurantiacibacter aquimixticola]